MFQPFPNSSGHINNFCQIMYFLQQKNVVQEEGGNKYVHKTDTEKGRGGSANADKAD